MKKIKFTLLICFLTSSNIFAQTSLSCNYREYCDWNGEDYVNCDGYEDNSLFVVNEQETMMEHTTNNMKSTYYLSNYEYDEEYDVHTYDVVSDVGNKYFYIFDYNSKEIRVVFERDGKTQLLTFTVKSIF